MGDYLANPACLLPFASGYGLVDMSGLPIAARWVHAALALAVLALGLGFGLAGPTLRQQLAIVEARGTDDAARQPLAARGAFVGAILGLLSLVILYLMVHKPSWARRLRRRG